MDGLNSPGAPVNLNEEIDNILNESLEIPGETSPPGQVEQPPHPLDDGSRAPASRRQPTEKPDESVLEEPAAEELSAEQVKELPAEIQDWIKAAAERLKSVEERGTATDEELPELSEEQLQQLPTEVQEHVKALRERLAGEGKEKVGKLKELSEDLLKQLPQDVQEYLTAMKGRLSSAEEEIRAAEATAQAHRTKVAEQGRKLDALNKALVVEDKSLDELVQSEETKFKQNYGEHQRIIQNARQQAQGWEAKAQECEELQDAAGAESARKNVKLWQDQELEAQLTAQSNLQMFNQWKISAQLQHRSKREKALLEAMPEFRTLQSQFEPFCSARGLNPQVVRGNMKIMQQVYQDMLDIERGKPENFSRIKKAIEKSVLKRAGVVRNAAQPGAGGSSRIIDTKSKDDSGLPDMMGSETYGGL